MSEDYEAEWEDIDGKVLLVQILTELRHIRRVLSESESDESRESEDVFRCERCGKTMPESACTQHARESHTAPPGAEMSLFEPYEPAK